MEPLKVKLEASSGTQSKFCNVVTRTQSVKETLRELPFYKAELKAGPVKLQRTKAQKRGDKFLGAPRERVEFPQPNDSLDFDIPPDVGALHWILHSNSGLTKCQRLMGSHRQAQVVWRMLLTS